MPYLLVPFDLARWRMFAKLLGNDLRRRSIICGVVLLPSAGQVCGRHEAPSMVHLDVAFRRGLCFNVATMDRLLQPHLLHCVLVFDPVPRWLGCATLADTSRLIFQPQEFMRRPRRHTRSVSLLLPVGLYSLYLQLDKSSHGPTLLRQVHPTNFVSRRDNYCDHGHGRALCRI